MNATIAIDIGASRMRAASYTFKSTEPILYNQIATRSEGIPIEDRLVTLIESVWPENYEIQMNESLQGALLLQKNLQGVRNTKEQKEKKYCEQCGALIHSHATHCPICGEFTNLNP